MKRRIRHHKPTASENELFLSLIEGLEGGFAIFAGIVIGLYLNGAAQIVLIATALISIAVNAVNAATIRYSTEHYLDELDGHERSAYRHYFVPAMVEFIVYLGISSIAIIPLLIAPTTELGIIVMIMTCLAILFIGGFIRGQRFRRHKWRDGFELAFGGSIIIVIGAVAGWILSIINVQL